MPSFDANLAAPSASPLRSEDFEYSASQGEPSSTKKQSGFSLNRRVLKEGVRLLRILTKTALAEGQKRATIHALRQGLTVAKQALALSKIVKAVFAFSQEAQNEKWTTKVYHWANMVQALVVGTVALAPLFNPRYNKANPLVAGVCLIRNSVKIIDLSNRFMHASDPEEKNLYLFKISKTILTLAASILVLVGTVFASQYLLLAIGLTSVVLGILKSFYKQTRMDPRLIC